MKFRIKLTLLVNYPNVQGNGFFSAKWFMNKNMDVVKILKEYEYKYPALPLPVPNLKKTITESLADQFYHQRYSQLLYFFSETKTAVKS